jgi:hypothetical protein
MLPLELLAKDACDSTRSRKLEVFAKKEKQEMLQLQKLRHPALML